MPKLRADARPAAPARSSWIPGALFIVAATLLAYAPALGAGFIWDDDIHFANNPHMTSLAGLKDLWVSSVFYYPLSSTTFWIERRLWGLSPAPYHWVNVLMHAANALLLWRLLGTLRLPGAWLAAALFALHPVNVQSVAWVTELKNTQSGLFYLTALLAYLKHERDGRARIYFLSLSAFALALLSKTSTVVMPLVLPILLALIGKPLDRRAALHWAPYFALSALAAAVTVGFHRYQVASDADFSETPLQRVVLAGRSVWFYLHKLLWPSTLAFVYPRWSLAATGAAGWLYPIAAIAAACAIALAARRDARARGAALALAYFVACLFPVLNFFKMYYTRYAYAADHWQYLAGMGIFAGGAAAGSRLLSRAPGRLRRAAAFALLGLCAGLTWRQARVYKTDEGMWRDTLRKNPECWMALTALASDLMNRGENAEAESRLLRSLAIKEDQFEAHYNLARLGLVGGRPDQAAIRAERALALAPADQMHDTLNLLGDSRVAQNRNAEAAELFGQAIAIQPELPFAHERLGAALERLGRKDEAISAYQRARALDPQSAAAVAAIARLQGI